MRHMTTPFMLAELAFFTLGIPLALWLFLPPAAILPAIWVGAAVTYHIVRMVTPKGERAIWKKEAVNWKNMKPLLLRFALCAVLMVAVTWYFKPDLLFNFVQNKTRIWLIVMLAYPLLSVIPQEIIFRTYLFKRFGGIMSPGALIILSAVSFGFAHIVFDNWIAPAMCIVGGLIFAETYRRTRSLALVVIEHALYGDFLFTVGLGRYFHHGAVGMPG